MNQHLLKMNKWEDCRICFKRGNATPLLGGRPQPRRKSLYSKDLDKQERKCIVVLTPRPIRL